MARIQIEIKKTDPEIVGKVTRLGSMLKNSKQAAIGCIVDSCGKCVYCRGGRMRSRRDD